MKPLVYLCALTLPVAFANAQNGSDNCSNAVEISFGTTAFSTINATDDGPELPGECDEGFGNGFGSDIWFTLTPEQSDGIIVSTCDSADFDTRLALYTECDGALLACNDDGAGCGGYTSEMAFAGVGGETYLLRVGGFDNERGTGTISVEFANAQNGSDNCSNAVEISFGTTAFSTINATDDGPELPGECDEGFGNGFGSDIWFTLTPEQSDGIIVSTCDSADFDTRLALYTECDGALLACNDDGAGCGGYTSEMAFAGVEGETYLLRVGGFDNERGTGTISVEYGEGPPDSPNINFQHDGLTRQYRIYTPADLPESAPLVLVLHGYGGGNNDMLNNYGWRDMADEGGFAAVFPNGTRDQSNDRFWDIGYAFHSQLPDVDDDGFLSSLAVHLQETLGLDPERTFVTGFSNGAEMCFQLACRESATFKGFAPIIGMMLDTLFLSCDPEFDRPILTMNGTADNVTYFNGDMNNQGGWGAYRPILEMVQFWVDELETPSLDRIFLDDTNTNDGSTVRLDIYTSREHDRELWYYQVNGGGHDWPGQWGNMDIDATREVWNFFAAIEPENPSNPADLNGDGIVDGGDLGLMLANWGEPGTSDLDGDGDTDGGDLGLLLASWSS